MTSSSHLQEPVDSEAGHVRFLRADRDTQATAGRDGRDSEPSSAGRSGHRGSALAAVLALQILLVVFPGQIAGAGSRNQRRPFILRERHNSETAVHGFSHVASPVYKGFL